MLAEPLAERLDPHAVGPHQADEAERRRQLLRVVELRRLAKVHRPAGVDEHVEVQILLFEEELHDQLVEPGVEIPIDRPQVVAGDVGAEIGELDALPLALAPPLALHPPAKHLAGHQLQSLELGQQVGR